MFLSKKAVSIVLLCLLALACFLEYGSTEAASPTIVQGETLQRQMLGEAQAQTKILERIARALEEIAKTKR